MFVLIITIPVYASNALLSGRRDVGVTIETGNACESVAKVYRQPLANAKGNARCYATK